MNPALGQPEAWCVLKPRRRRAGARVVSLVRGRLAKAKSV
jgi:hypothetical protein